MSNVTPEAVALRHAHAGQAARNNFSSAQSADQASPFASLLDGNDPLPSPPSPALTPPSGQKPAVRPQDDLPTRSSSPATAASPEIAPSDRAAPRTQTGDSSPPNGPQGSDGAETALALGALSKKSAKDADPTIDPSVLAIVATVAASATDANVAAAVGSSTAAASIDIHADKTAQSDAATSDTATPPAAPSADPSGAVAPQPVAVPISVPVSLPVIPAAPTGSGRDREAGQDAAQLAAAADAVKAGAAGADRAGTKAATGDGAAAGDGATTGSRAGASKPGAQAPEAAAIPSLTPQPAQKDLISPGGTGQRNAADALSGNAAGSPGAAANRARQRATDSPPTDGAPQDNANVDPNIDPNGDSRSDLAGSTTSRIEDITRQALDNPARHLEAAAAETPGGGAAHPGSAQTGSAPQPPDGSSGLIAPAALTTSAASTAPATTTEPATAIPIAGLAVEIASHATAGKNRFEIRLDPPELGRIDVRLDVDREGKVTSRLVVDRPETLDILRRDAPALERSLQLAGLKTADDALQFSLRDQSQGGFGSQNPYSNNGSPASAARIIIPDRELPPVDTHAVAYNRVRPTSTGVDIRV